MRKIKEDKNHAIVHVQNNLISITKLLFHARSKKSLPRRGDETESC